MLESDKFLTGLPASNEPVGILSIGQTGALSTSQRVQTATTATFALGDNYLLAQALPARFRAGATVAAHPTTFDTIYRQVGGGSTERPVMPTRDGGWLGVPKVQWSSMATGTVTGTKTIVYGDWSNFTIVDRVGMSVELVPLLGGASHRPTGQRGAYCYWRVGSSVTVLNAFRYLEIK